MQNYSHALLTEAEDKWCRDHQVQVTHPGCTDYPLAFMGLTYRPARLFYYGHPVWKKSRLISVVGSRAPREKSLSWLEQTLAEVINKLDVVVVSGGARGVDQKAHKIALAHDKPTVVFLPSGLGHFYPKELNEWKNQIVSAGGCIISPFSPLLPMQKRFFRQRNHLIAAISELTLVVECRRRSGTLITARSCLDFEKPLAVMPSAPYDVGLGGLDLICDEQAMPVRGAQDIISLIGQSS